MKKHGKKYRSAQEKFDALHQDTLSIAEGVTKIKELKYTKFDETVRADINLGIDPLKGDQVVRGSVTLPHGLGKQIKILVFAKGEYADQAEKAGADYVGLEDLLSKIEQENWVDFDYAIATPDLMGQVGKVAKILGPRGLLPNKKSGTVTFDIASIIKDLKGGRIFFKNDKSGLVHFSFGKVSFPSENLAENLTAFLRALSSSRPPTTKGKFIRKITISSTMGVGIPINPDEAL